MAELLSVFTPRLLFGVISLNLLQILSADLRSVDPGQNITLLCNFTASSQISWFHMNSSGVREIIIIRRMRLNKSFYIEYNEDKSQFALAESRSSVSLEIIGVRETELGFYYCGGQNEKDRMKFGKPIRLNFTETRSSSEGPDSLQPVGKENCSITNRIFMCVCSVSVLTIIIGMCVFCMRVKGKSSSASFCCRRAPDNTEKEQNLPYASVQWEKQSRRFGKKNPAADLDSVTYATVASQPRRQ